MKKVKWLVLCLLLMVAIGAAIYVIFPIVTGSTKFLIVLSGSMSPIISTGDLVVVTPVDPGNTNVGEIIAHEDPDRRENVIITHRVVEIIEEEGDLRFRTKGDANEDADLYTVDATDLVGKVTFVIPFLGYFFHYVRENKLFLLLLVIVPAMLIIIDEVRKIIIQSNPVLARKAIKEENKRKKNEKRIKVDYKKFLSLFLIFSIPFFIISAPSLAMSGNVDAVAKHFDQTFLKFEKQEIKNAGLIPCVLVFDPTEKISYRVLPRGNATEIEIGTETESETTTSVSSVPYIIPVFWIVQLALVNPFLPALVTALIPPLIISFLFYPVWLKDIRKRRRKKKKR